MAGCKTDFLCTLYNRSKLYRRHYAFDSLPKLNYRKEINLKERNKLCGGTFEKVFPNKRCFVTGGVILGFMKQTPLNAHGEGGGGCSFTEQFLMSVPFF